MIKSAAALLTLLGVLGCVRCQCQVGPESPSPLFDLVTTNRVVQSRSGQFTIGVAPVTRVVARAPAANSAVPLLHLNPNLLAVSCEQVKHAVLQILGLTDAWRGKVNITIHPFLQGTEPQVVAVHYTGGWSYRVDLPEHSARLPLLNAILHVVLLEMANRSSGPLSAELPPWLVPGLGAHLQATRLGPMLFELSPQQSGSVLSPLLSGASLPAQAMRMNLFPLDPGAGNTVTVKQSDILASVRAQFASRPPLSWDDLNWPPADMAKPDSDFYRVCAHFFVFELLRLPLGKECLRTMLFSLTQHLNWQTTFLDAFAPYFRRLIDVEKWWALNCVYLTGRDKSQMWPAAESLNKLEETLRTPVRIRLHKNDLPVDGQVPLQRVIEGWKYEEHRRVVELKMNYLAALRIRVARDLVPLVDRYHNALFEYLQARDNANAPGGLKNEIPPSPRLMVRRVVEQLDALDRERARLATKPAPPAASNPRVER